MLYLEEIWVFFACQLFLLFIDLTRNPIYFYSEWKPLQEHVRHAGNAQNARERLRQESM